MKSKWEFKADQLKMEGTTYKTIQGLHHDCASFIYFDSIAKEYPGLQTDVIKLAIEQPKLLLHKGVLTAFKFTYPAL
jgi:hypothetical protein